MSINLFTDKQLDMSLNVHKNLNSKKYGGKFQPMVNFFKGKTILLLLVIICFSFVVNAQVSKSVEATPGSLSSALTTTELTTITNLTLTGTIDARDFKTMRDLMPALAEINISEVTITAYSGNEGPVLYLGVFPANTLPDYAFYDKNNSWAGKTKLTSILLPKSITALGVYCFSLSSGLTSVVIPSSVTSIGAHAFDDCSSLTTVSIPSSVTSIGAYAFINCSKLSSVSIPSSVTSIGAYAFIYCSKLSSVVIPSSLTSIGEGTFSNCSSLTTVSIPSSVTSIGAYAFINCSKLSSIVIPSSVTSIGECAFWDCIMLSSITIPSSVTSIGFSVFEGCAALIEVDVNNQTYSSLDGVLYDKAQTKLIQCSTSKVGSVTIPSTVTSIGANAFKSCSQLTTVTIPPSVTTIATSTFMNCTSLTSITIPSSVISIEEYAFKNCSRLLTIVIPPSVTTIGNSAFDECSSLATISIPSSVISIGRGVFYGCSALIDIDSNNPNYSSLNSVIYNKDKTTLIQCPDTKTGKFVIPSSVTSIGDWAFWGCSWLNIISIPSSVISIKSGAFAGCYGLTSIIAANPIPVNRTSTSHFFVEVFNGVNKTTCTLYVPVGSKSAYQAATVWKDFTNIVEDPKIPTGIEPIINKKQLTAYPNPTSGKVKLVFDQVPNSGSYLIVTDVTGKTILKQFIYTTEEWIDLQGNTPGVYLIKTNLKELKVQKVLLK